MTKVKWGIIGLGNIATKFAEAIQHIDEGFLYAVAARDKEKSEAFGKKFGVKANKCYGSYDDLLKNPEVQAIYIAVPHAFHKEIALMAFDYNKAVLCEKPATIDSKELQEILDVANQKKLFFMEAMKTRFLPAIRQIKEIIANDLIGTVKYVQGNQGFFVPYNLDNRLFNKSLGGGSLLDVGVYPLSLIQFLFDEDLTDICKVISFNEDHIDTSVSLIAKSSSGIHLNIFTSIQTNTPRDMIIGGTKGYIHIPKFSSAQSFTINVNNTEENFSYPHIANGLEYQIIEASKCISANQMQSSIMSWDDSLTVSKWIDSVFE